uniref:Uncharacterized protein n=1 Tax=Rhizophora mucronata TaxID=61149 RepID=A0A2P2J2I0_RHIMU
MIDLEKSQPIISRLQQRVCQLMFTSPRWGP